MFDENNEFEQKKCENTGEMTPEAEKIEENLNTQPYVENMYTDVYMTNEMTEYTNMPEVPYIIEEMPKKKKKAGFFKPVLISLTCAIVAGFVFAVTAVCTENILKNATREIETTQSALTKNKEVEAVKLSYSESTGAAEASTIENIVDACLPSVVSITNKGVSEVVTFFGNYQTESISSGSGIIIGQNETELLIVTNYHVVADSKELTVVFSHEEASAQNGDTSYVNPAQVKGYDADKDIAVIAVKIEDISDDTMDKIRIATIGNSDNVKLGSGVVAIGNSLGYGQSVTHGIVSAINREVTMQGVEGGMITNEYIQTDAAINSGNSGGALLNMQGEVIGINSAKIAASGVEGMGYAIPITDVKELIDQLMTLKTRDVVDEDERGYLGIYGTDVTSQVSEAYGMPMGVFIQDIIENSPADESELEIGDIVTKIDGYSVTSMAGLQNRLAYYKAGETVTFTVKRIENREYVEETLEVTLGSREDAGIDD